MTDAPKITPGKLERAVASEHYFTALDGAQGYHSKSRYVLPTEAHEALSLLTFCVLVLRNGFTVVGHSACVSKENFNEEKGREAAREHAIEQMWPLLGYALKDRIHEEKSQ